MGGVRNFRRKSSTRSTAAVNIEPKSSSSMPLTEVKLLNESLKSNSGTTNETMLGEVVKDVPGKSGSEAISIGGGMFCSSRSIFL